MRETQTKLLELLKAKVAEGCDKNKLFDLVEKLVGSKNPNNVRDIDVLNNAIDEIGGITPNKL